MLAKFTASFALDVDRWSYDKDQVTKERRASGKTSLNVSKSTVAALRLFAARIAKLAPKKHEWHENQAPSPDELLAAIAGGAVHAFEPSTKGMPRSPAKRKVKRSTRKKPGRRRKVRR